MFRVLAGSRDVAVDRDAGAGQNFAHGDSWIRRSCQPERVVSALARGTSRLSQVGRTSKHPHVAVVAEAHPQVDRKPWTRACSAATVAPSSLAPPRSASVTAYPMPRPRASSSVPTLAVCRLLRPRATAFPSAIRRQCRPVATAQRGLPTTSGVENASANASTPIEGGRTLCRRRSATRAPVGAGRPAELGARRRFEQWQILEAPAHHRVVARLFVTRGRPGAARGSPAEHQEIEPPVHGQRRRRGLHPRRATRRRVPLLG